MTTGGGAGGSAGQADTLYIDLKGRFDDFERQLKTLHDQSVSQAGDAGKKSGSAFGNAMSAGIKIAGTAALALGGVLVTVGGAALAAGDEVDKAVKTIRTGTGATGKDLQALKGDFENVAKGVPEDLGTVSKVLADLNTRTGQTGEGLQGLTKSMLDLARVSGDDVNSLVASTTRLFGDWGIATKDQTTTLDGLWKVSQTTGIGVDELAQRVVQFGAPLRQLGFGLDESAALLGKFEKEGVNSEVVMSSLRIALGNLADQSQSVTKYQAQQADIQAKLTKEIAKNGEDSAKAADLKDKLATAETKLNDAISASDAPKALREKIDLIKSVGTTSEANAIAATLFGKKAGPDMAAAIREGRFEIADLLKTLHSSKETIASAAADSETLGQSYAQIKNGVTLALAPLGQLALNGIKPLIPLIQTAVSAGATWIKNLSDSGRVQEAAKTILAGLNSGYNTIKSTYVAVSGAVSSATKFFERNKEILIPLTAAVAAGATAFGVYRLAVAAVTLATTIWTTAQTVATVASVALKAGLTFLTGPVGLVIAAITLLVGAGVALYRNWDEVKAFAEKTWGKIVSIVKGALDGAVSFLKSLDMKEIGLQIVRGLVNGILAGPALVLNAARNLGSKVIEGVKGVLGIQSPSRVLHALGEFTSEGFVNGINSKQGSVRDAAKGTAAAFLSAFRDLKLELAAGNISQDAYIATLQKVAAQLRSQIATVKEGTPAYSEYLSALGKVNTELTRTTGKSQEAQRAAKGHTLRTGEKPRRVREDHRV